jgi:hypothetical protein
MDQEFAGAEGWEFRVVTHAHPLIVTRLASALVSTSEDGRPGALAVEG